MRIVHIAPNAPYNDYWGYQENLLPKYHRQLGHEVMVITTNTKHENGNIVEIEEADYKLKDGVRVVRLKRKKYISRILTGLRSYIPVYDILSEYRPDFIFFHGLSSNTIFDAIRYKKKLNMDCVIVQDNHMDPYNNNYKTGIKARIIRWYYHCINTLSQRSVDRVFGVTPWRVQYARRYFGIETDKLDLLIMGADDSMLNFDDKSNIRTRIRNRYNLSEDDFLVVTGGKIDGSKNIDVLINVCARIDNIKLLIFGTITTELKESLETLINDSSNIIHIGWIDSSEVYDYFMSADLVCFPGTHSVMWEQACACKVPCLFKRWEGMEHVNNGGNSTFISEVTEANLYSELKNLIRTEKYFEMKKVAESENTSIYLYSKIAEKSLEVFR